MSTETRKGKKGKKGEMSLDVLKKKLCKEQQKLHKSLRDLVDILSGLKPRRFWGQATMERFRVEVSYPTSKSGFWWRIRYGLAKVLLGKGYFHESNCWTREDLDELRRQNLAHDFTKGYEKEVEELRRQNEGDENG